MNITIAGGGNVGTQFAVHCAQKGHIVTIYTSRPHSFARHITIMNEEGRQIHEGEIACATDDVRAAFSNADVIFITVPPYSMYEMAQKILPYAHKGMMIGLIPGTGGGECAFRACMKKGCTIFGLQRVPSVARLIEYGHSVRAIGYRGQLFVAAMPSAKSGECSNLITALFDIRCDALPCYLNVTLTPSNPILHTTRLRTLFQDYRDGVTYTSVPLFYEEWDDESSRLLFHCDGEIQDICNALKEFDLSSVKPLRIHYESSTPEKLTKKISSIQGFKGLETPALEQNGKYIPDLTSRYFTADFEYGLSILVQVGEFAGVPTPYMKETLEWYYRIAGSKKGFRFADYGITSYEELVAYYRI